MNTFVTLSQQLSARALRASMAVILIWIGGLKFADPAPVVGLLNASFPFLATNAVVYLLGVAEVLAGVGLIMGVALRWIGLLMMGLFAGTLTIFVIAPAVTYGEAGFPFLSLPGEFLLKDLALFAVSFALVGVEESSPRTAPAAKTVAVRA